MRTSLLFAILVFVLVIAQSGSGAAQGGAAQAAGDPANGKAVFAFGNTSCTNCHGLEGQGGWGPDLAGRRITYDQAIKAIRNPTWRMPAFVPSQLSDKEITYTLIALRRYEKALQEEEGEDMEDAATDLIIVQGLISKLSAAKRNP